MAIDKITNTLQTIKNDKSLEDHFFKKLAAASKPLEWLDALRDAGYFSPEKNPSPQKVLNKEGYVTIPHWSILDSLVNMVVKNQEKPSADVSMKLLEIVDGIINYRDENGERITNFRTDWKLLEAISHLPIEYIGEQHIKFIDEALCQGMGASLLDRELGKLFLPKLIKEKAINLILQLLEVILHYRKSNNKFSDEYVSVIDNYYLVKTLEGNKRGIAEICAVEAAKIVIAKMREILNEDNSQFNYIWIPAIEEHEQTTSPDRYECQLVYFVRDMLEAASPKEVEPIVVTLLEEENDIFKRLAYHLLNYHYDALEHLLWGIPNNPLNDLMAIHELYELLSTHCKNFNNTQIETILNWIETKDYHFSDRISGDVEQENHVRAYYKKEWLQALLDSNNEEVKRRYDSYHSINDAPLEHPGFHYWSFGAGWVKEVSPIDKDEFNSMSNDEFADYINSYKDDVDKIRSIDFTRISLASAVRTFVLDDPERFSANLTPFLSVPRKYQFELLKAFDEAWRNEKNFDWSELLSFMHKMIENADFWSEDKPEDKNDHKRWITDAIANLIEEGTKNDKHAFAADFLPQAEQIIIILLNNVKSNMEVINDLITSVMNSPKGKVYVAAINYSLRYARLYCRERDDRWINSIKSEFEARLDKTKEPSLEFSTVIGWYLVNLHYLDKEWVIKNFNKIFDMKSENHWEAAFVGYIVMTSTIYEEIYNLLKDNGHYEKGLSRPFKDKQAEEKLVQNIAIGYLAGWDDFENDDSLLRKLFDVGNIKYISEIVSYVSTFGNKDEERKTKIKPLWKAIIEKIEPNLDKEEYRVVASNLGKWLNVVDIIDEDIFEWLLVSAKVINDDWHSSLFVDYLLKHVTKTPKMVGDIYMQMLSVGICPEYHAENIIEIVQALFDSDEKTTAAKICNIYFLKGFEFLRETFNKNKS